MNKKDLLGECRKLCIKHSVLNKNELIKRLSNVQVKVNYSANDFLDLIFESEVEKVFAIPNKIYAKKFNSIDLHSKEWYVTKSGYQFIYWPSKMMYSLIKIF